VQHGLGAFAGLFRNPELLKQRHAQFGRIFSQGLLGRTLVGHVGPSGISGQETYEEAVVSGDRFQKRFGPVTFVGVPIAALLILRVLPFSRAMTAIGSRVFSTHYVNVGTVGRWRLSQVHAALLAGPRPSRGD
jgi:hypothetical protein